MASVIPAYRDGYIDTVASMRQRRPAALSAFYLAFVLGLFGSAGYGVLIRGDDILRRLVVLVIFMVTKPGWLTPPHLQRRSVIQGAMEMDPADVPPRTIAEMTGQELAEWARGDPEKLRRLRRRRY